MKGYMDFEVSCVIFDFPLLENSRMVALVGALFGNP
jgi:hypothetical protein